MGWIKLNSDGASKSSSSVAACGGVFRDSNGNWILGFAKRLGHASPFLAELWGILLGLQLAADLGFDKLEIELDSISVVNVLNNIVVRESSCGRHIIRRLRSLVVGSSWNISTHHIFREANTVANGLANLGCSLANDTPIVTSPHPLSVLSNFLLLIIVEFLLLV